MLKKNSPLLIALQEYHHVIKPVLHRHLERIAEKNDRHDHGVLLPLAEYVFNTPSVTQGMRKALVKVLFDFDVADIALLTVIHALSGRSKNPVNVDAILQHISHQTQPLDVMGIYGLNRMGVKTLRKYLNDKRLLKLLWGSDLGCVSDTVAMIKMIEDARPNANFFPKKPKNLTDLHNAFSRMMSKIGQADFALSQREDILMLDRRMLTDELQIRVPNTHYDLIDLGEDLSFCIGNGSYSRQVANGKNSIIALFKNGKAAYGIEFNRYRILQAQGFANRPECAPPLDVLTALKNMVLSAPMSENDFLPITDSNWIQGYRYTDNDLYLLLNDVVYVYQDVPEDVYEELLNSNKKGRYVNREIKPCYSCERIGHISTMNINILE